MPFGTPKVPNGANPAFEFSPFWTPFLRFFEPGLALRGVFNPYSKNYTLFSFLDNSGPFSNNYLLDKYS